MEFQLQGRRYDYTEGVRTYGVPGLWPRAEGLQMDIRTFSLLFSVRARHRGLTRNIEYTPATHIPSLPTQPECAVGGGGVLGGAPEESHGCLKES